MTYRLPIYLGEGGKIGDNSVVMSTTYGYSLCRHCGGSGKSDEHDCPACQGAGMTSAEVTEVTAKAVKAVASPTSSILQHRTTDFVLPRHLG